MRSPPVFASFNHQSVLIFSCPQCLGTPQYQPDEHPPYRHQNTYPQFSSPEETPHGLDSSPIPFSLDHSKDPRQPPKSHSQPAEQFSRPPESRRRNSTTGYGRRRNANEGPSTPKLPRARKMTFQNLNLQNLTVPPRKLAADPPLITQLKSILFGNCASQCLIYSLGF